MVALADKLSTPPFPYFGGKRTVAAAVWQRLGRPKMYIEPFCGGAAVLLSAPAIASLEVIGDQNFYVANFWRCIKNQPDAVYDWQDYPVSHVDIDARHRWLTEPDRTRALRDQLADAEWPGDPQIAGWWVWGQCCWIGDGWCASDSRHGDCGGGYQKPQLSNGGMGVHAQVPFVGNGGRGSQSVATRVPFLSSPGQGVTQAAQGVLPKKPHVTDAGRGIQSVTGVKVWFRALAERLARVRVIHGDWTRCLNHHYGGQGASTAIFFDPPYKSFEKLYGDHGDLPVAEAVAEWCRSEEAAGLRIALCGHTGDYDLPGWDIMPWSRAGNTYGSAKTKDAEAIWFSPACLPASQGALF